ncbi:MAG TPA: ABC transporter permease [Anaerolineales bacterium]|nr:ABC transporter permease [Anaerolineales bacterium]
MNILGNIRIAFRALTANKLRSGLTMLGIIIGVAAVVALMSIGRGATRNITSRVEGLGSNLIAISSARNVRQAGVGAQTTPLYFSDYQAIAKDTTNVVGIAPVYQTSAQVMYGSNQSQFSITGVTPEFAGVNAYAVTEGRFISNYDNSAESRVVVLGSQAATDLFSGLNPLGGDISINGINFTVVGVLASKGSTGFFSQDDVILIPLETGYTRVFGGRALTNGQRVLSTISLSAANSNVVSGVISQVEYILRRDHQLTLTDTLPFSVSSQSQALSTLTSITTTLTAFLGAIAGISLFVGGIGIMNIMLVSVRERTREIGLRKAVGAKRSVILMQFIVETITLSLIGGILGILLGAGIAGVVTLTGLITTYVSWDVILYSFFFAALVGLFFGIYPAYQAASLRPIEALRYE